ncbi:nucleoside/nucleotide kinase family protein [Aestuariibius sp. 2305UL40-4]|uniref:nucleoside/nucleotide kinase family protein n=1 Tax=Aestuariibius violaceus TaxID=3234132 RepID=UPI00345E7DBB
MATRIDEESLKARLAALRSGARSLVAIAGPPGSGKSTLAETLESWLNEREPGRAAVLGMDGYHYDDRVLELLDRKSRKGSPDTFDVSGLAHMLSRLKTNDEWGVAVPVFDRDIEIARAAARIIPREVEILLIEGNYLLSGEPPWSDLASLFDLRILIEVAPPTLATRLRRRWEGYGLSEPAIRTKLDQNDLPNGQYVIAHSRNPDFILRQ